MPAVPTFVALRAIDSQAQYRKRPRTRMITRSSGRLLLEEVDLDPHALMYDTAGNDIGGAVMRASIAYLDMQYIVSPESMHDIVIA
jgi:hypothetical protein